MSVCTRGRCPHGRGVFAYLADGPQRGDENDLNWGRYPWVHDTSADDGRGHLEICNLMPFALPVDVGEMCACGHSSDMHKAADDPIPAGMLAKPRLCHCGCPDFRHRREDLERWGAKPPEAAPTATKRPPARPAPSGPAVQLELFAIEPAPRPGRVGPRGWPLCEACGRRESIGPPKPGEMSLCSKCWSPVLDPAGAASWDRIEARRVTVETVRVAGGVL